MALDFRARVAAAQQAADDDDMAEAMAGPPPEVEVPDATHCCPECGAEFTEAEEQAADATREDNPDDMDGDYDGFTLGSRS